MGIQTKTLRVRLSGGLLWVLEQIPGLIHAEDQVRHTHGGCDAVWNR